VRDLDVPVFATRGVDEVIRRDDPVKDQILRPMIGAEWATERAFANTIVTDGETIRRDGIALAVTDLGPGECPHDSIWTLEGDRRTVFSADVAYDRRHCYLADGFYEDWLANIARLRNELPSGTTLHPGHGEPCGTEVLDWQERYIEALTDAVRTATWTEPVEARAAVVERMRDLLPTDELQSLMELSIDPLAAKLGVA
jgi:glyoxylase-like metal-dependent hydrolase (beta-lactamase superfamily II)